MGLLRIEFRRSFCLWLSPFMVAALAWTAYGPLPAGIWLWTETVWSLQSSLLLFGPLVGGLAVWVAGRERRRQTEDLLSTTPHPTWGRDVAVWAATAAWCCLAYAAVVAGLFTATWMNADWGSPETGPVLAGLLAVAAHAAVGYAAGSFVPSRLTAPLFAVAMYGFQGLLVFGSVPAFRQLSPLGGDVAETVFYDESPEVFLRQSLWLIALAATALALVALRRRRSTGSWAALAMTATVAVVAASTLTSVPVQTVDARGEPVPYEPVCKEGRITVCLHPAYETALPETARVLEELAAPLLGSPGAPERAEQSGNAYPSRLSSGGTFLFDIRGAFNRSNVDSGFVFEDYMRPDLATALVAGPSGYVEQDTRAYENGDPCRGNGEPPGEAQRAVAGWLVFQTGGYGSTDSAAFWEATNGGLCPQSAVAVERFDALAPSERRAWLRENYPELRAGKLALDDLP